VKSIKAFLGQLKLNWFDLGTSGFFYQSVFFHRRHLQGDGIFSPISLLRQTRLRLSGGPDDYGCDNKGQQQECLV